MIDIFEFRLTLWDHLKSMYALKGGGVPKKAYENVQKGGGLFRERTYACVIFTK